MALNRRSDYVALSNPNFAAEHREAVQRAEEQRAAARQLALAAQTAEANDPQKRIETWEKLHALALPSSPAHALVLLIARQTRLTIAQVHEEQRRRSSVATT